jgi:hypothetical protein
MRTGTRRRRGIAGAISRTKRARQTYSTRRISNKNNTLSFDLLNLIQSVIFDEPIACGEPAESVQLGRLQVIDELQHILMKHNVLKGLY